jgi:hypothetical protein
MQGQDVTSVKTNVLAASWESVMRSKLLLWRSEQHILQYQCAVTKRNVVFMQVYTHTIRPT